MAHILSAASRRRKSERICRGGPGQRRSDELGEDQVMGFADKSTRRMARVMDTAHRSAGWTITPIVDVAPRGRDDDR